MKLINKLTKPGGIKSVAVREDEVIVDLVDGKVIVYKKKEVRGK